ncbi:zinc finger MYM-type protein 1-like [Acyrthosiphon pisum]|uniref:DUF4371 domain-containing protein n=1 Tax=Acyrthosiphon pisum TaxID=7029 RepID=A0A8R2B8W7_ACYPI|nr:zinc finger MYM-type protein 1-like [Acyrthosiphon pisum]|eukprot:XP_008187396.1 PREDICTED: zinc finger MYM-type protein 1-like [Acyrthosiphon pisum]
MSLRGKTDSGRINVDEEVKTGGKFRELLKFRVKAGDEILKKHLTEGSSNAQFTSAKVQNQLINICSDIISEKIVEKVNRAKIFSVMADETTDVSKQEQMSLCIRYIDPDLTCPLIREDFLKFVVVSDLSGQGLAKTIIENLQSAGINLNFLIGQSYDGAAYMSGHLNGAQAVIRKKYPKALFVHFSAHSLNLAINDACKITVVRNTVGSVSSVCNFFRGSAQRTDVLKKHVINHFPSSR